MVFWLLSTEEVDYQAWTTLFFKLLDADLYSGDCLGYM